MIIEEIKRYLRDGNSLRVSRSIRDMAYRVLKAREELGEREKKILFLRYYEGKTQTEISEEVGISQAQVSRLEKNALQNIRLNISWKCNKSGKIATPLHIL